MEESVGGLKKTDLLEILQAPLKRSCSGEGIEQNPRGLGSKMHGLCARPGRSVKVPTRAPPLSQSVCLPSPRPGFPGLRGPRAPGFSCLGDRRLRELLCKVFDIWRKMGFVWESSAPRDPVIAAVETFTLTEKERKTLRRNLGNSTTRCSESPRALEKIMRRPSPGKAGALPLGPGRE